MIHERIDKMECELLKATTMKSMYDALITLGERIFGLDVITVTLERELKPHWPDTYHENDGSSVFLNSSKVAFLSPAVMATHFTEQAEPLLRGTIRNGTSGFFSSKYSGKVRSEALAPIHNGERIIGVMAFGSFNPKRFEEGFGARFLTRLARIIALKTEYFRATIAGFAENNQPERFREAHCHTE